MTRISSYRLVQCSSCGQKHILPNYGSINMEVGIPVDWSIRGTDVRCCQRCSAYKQLKDFITLTTLYKPEPKNNSYWLKTIRKLFNKDCKELNPHPMELYPNLESTPFDPETYFPELINKYMKENNSYPAWFLELKLRKI
jgi:hypothetical protein